MVEHVRNVKFLGFMFYIYKKATRLRIHLKTVPKMKRKIKELIARSNGRRNARQIEALRRYIIGWINYFKIADIEILLKEVD